MNENNHEVFPPNDVDPDIDEFGRVDISAKRRDAVCVIPARGGSKRIPRKNIRDFFGKPIIAYSIAAARESRLFTAVRVTTDDAEIAAIAKQYGARPVMREFDDGSRSTQEVARSCIAQVDAVNPTAHDYCKYICTVYPCAPMMRAQDLRQAYAILKANLHIGYVVPCAEWLVDPGMFYFGRFHTVMAEDGNDLLRDRVRLMKIPTEIAIDINTESDWRIAERKYLALEKAKNEQRRTA